MAIYRADSNPLGTIENKNKQIKTNKHHHGLLTVAGHGK